MRNLDPSAVGQLHPQCSRTLHRRRTSMRGADLDDIRRLLGQADLRMTIRYAHLLPGHLGAAASRLDGVLSLPSAEDEADKNVKS